MWDQVEPVGVGAGAVVAPLAGNDQRAAQRLTGLPTELPVVTGGASGFMACAADGGFHRPFLEVWSLV